MPSCPALLITAPGSGHGKTTVTAALARWHRRAGRKVQVFKTGPDYLDPMVLERASGRPVYSLDLWMVGEEACARLLAAAAAEVDLILIEGVMGLYDGQPSSADLALRFNLPVLPVIQCRGMAQTFGALVYGLAHYRPGIQLLGVFANRVGSANHLDMLQQALPAGIPWLGHLCGDTAYALGERHLGLQQAGEIDDLDTRLEAAADALEGLAMTTLPPPLSFSAWSTPPLPQTLAGLTIAVARDAAFSFIYPANLELLQTLGAQLQFFSPLADEAVPASADALYLPGGYPELHAGLLNQATHSALSIRAMAAAGKPILAECGGLLYLLEHLSTADGRTHAMLGLLPGEAVMQSRLAALGMQQLDTPMGRLRGHCFHYSRISTPLQARWQASHPLRGTRGEAVYQHGSITASYMHGYWPSNPELIAAIFHGRTF
ncbi:cobyrinate a,c-diamide synthase [Frateuria aurantia]